MYRILVVDDHVENIQTIIQLLESLYPEARYYQATDGKAGLYLCENNSFDLVISDWDMPGMSGIDLIRSLKSNDRTKHIPVIIVTAIMLTAADLKVALTAGAHDYIRNPVDPLELTARVNAALTLSKKHREELRKKDAELLEKTMIHAKNNEFSIELAKKLTDLSDICKDNADLNNNIQSLLSNLDQKIHEDSWKSFEVSFQAIHTDFIRDLLAKFPNLSSAEIRLCILLKLGLSIKDMAMMLYQSPESLKVSRSRLRNKLAIDKDLSFQSFFSSF